MYKDVSLANAKYKQLNESLAIKPRRLLVTRVISHLSHCYHTWVKTAYLSGIRSILSFGTP